MLSKFLLGLLLVAASGVHEEQLDDGGLLGLPQDLPQNPLVAEREDRWRLVVHGEFHNDEIRLFGEHLVFDAHGAKDGIGAANAGVHKMHFGIREGFGEPIRDLGDIAVLGIFGLQSACGDRPANGSKGDLLAARRLLHHADQSGRILRADHSALSDGLGRDRFLPAGPVNREQAKRGQDHAGSAKECCDSCSGMRSAPGVV